LSGERVPVWIAATATLPLVIVTAGILLFSVGEVAGRTPFSHGPARNVAEAAGMGNASEVLRFLWLGGDPNQITDVRPHIISSQIVRVTALEAAVWSRRVQLLELLDRQGAIIGEHTRAHLACLASDINAADIVEYFVASKPACTPNVTVDAIIARSAPERHD
jgi:hypothetical protein